RELWKARRISGFEAVPSAGSEYQSFRTRSYSAWLNASVASRSRAEAGGAIGVPAFEGDRLATIVPTVNRRVSCSSAVMAPRQVLSKGSDRRSLTMLKG